MRRLLPLSLVAVRMGASVRGQLMLLSEAVVNAAADAVMATG